MFYLHSPYFSRAISPTLESVDSRRYAIWAMEVWRCIWRSIRPDSVHPAERFPGMKKTKKSIAAKVQEWQRQFAQHSSLRSCGSPTPPKIVALIGWLCSISTYRRPMRVTEFILYKGTFGTESAFYLCPRCDITLEREYQSYCDRCGQRLNWKCVCKAKRRN